MSIILDDLKARLDDARSRLILASQEYQAAGAKLQQVQNECNVWTAALGLETREEEKRLSKAMENQLPMDLPDLAEAPKGENPPEEAHLEPATPTVATNKTQKVREILAEHSGGIAPAGIWTEVKDNIASRAYLYAILKRLRDNDEVSIRKGKYVLKPKPIAMNSAETEGIILQ